MREDRLHIALAAQSALERHWPGARAGRPQTPSKHFISANAGPLERQSAWTEHWAGSSLSTAVQDCRARSEMAMPSRTTPGRGQVGEEGTGSLRGCMSVRRLPESERIVKVLMRPSRDRERLLGMHESGNAAGRAMLNVDARASSEVCSSK